MTINHIHLGTKNLDISMEFYRKYFGFQKKSDHGSGAFLENEAGFLIAIDPVVELPHFPDWYHIGFCLKSEREVLEMHESMKNGSVNIVRELKTSPQEFASFYIKDPDGNKIEISWHNE